MESYGTNIQCTQIKYKYSYHILVLILYTSTHIKYIYTIQYLYSFYILVLISSTFCTHFEYRPPSRIRHLQPFLLNIIKQAVISVDINRLLIDM